MEKIDVTSTIIKFIKEKGYLENEHVLGVLFYGSYLTGYNSKDSDIDLHIIFDNSNPDVLIRGNDHVDGYRIEYFEKPINDLYLSVDNDFNEQNNALLSIVGNAKIILDKTGDIQVLQNYTLNKFSKPLPKLDENKARELVSIIDNRIPRLEKLARENSPYFYHLFHLTVEKIRKFYHKINGLPEVQTSKVYRVYQDENYRNSFAKGAIPDDEFVSMFLDLCCDRVSDQMTLYSKLIVFYAYAKRNVILDKNSYRILIESRNKTSQRRNVRECEKSVKD